MKKVVSICLILFCSCHFVFGQTRLDDKIKALEERIAEDNKVVNDSIGSAKLKRLKKWESMLQIFN